MKTLTAIILMTSIAFSQTKCVIDPDDVELSNFGKTPAQEGIEYWVNENDSVQGLISYSWLKVDSIFHNGKPDCIHEWRNKSPERRCQLEYKSKQVKTYLIEDKTYIRVCAKCIRNEKVTEQCWGEK